MVTSGDRIEVFIAIKALGEEQTEGGPIWNEKPQFPLH